MNQANKQLWVDALRSGEYKQIKGYLRTDKGYCCLGVAYEAVLGRSWEKDPCDLQSGFCYWTAKHEACGIADYRTELELLGTEEFDLAEMNDEGKTFEEIATYIEAEL